MMSDRLLRLRSKYYQRQALALLRYQPFLRQVFEFDAWLSFKPFRGAMEISDVTVGGVSGLRFRPPGLPSDAQKLMYLHGGGFTIGSPRTHKWMLARLAHLAGIEIFAPNYRKAPEHPFPAAQEDALATARAYRPDFVGGDSAGGCLSLYLSTQVDLQGMVLLSPLADQSRLKDADFSNEHLIPRAWVVAIQKALKADVLDPRASPLLGDLSAAPRTLIQVGSQEVLRHDADQLAQKLPDAHLSIYEAMPHVWQLNAGKNASADRALTEIAEFLKGVA